MAKKQSKIAIKNHRKNRPLSKASKLPQKSNQSYQLSLDFSSLNSKKKMTSNLNSKKPGLPWQQIWKFLEPW